MQAKTEIKVKKPVLHSSSVHFYKKEDTVNYSVFVVVVESRATLPNWTRLVKNSFSLRNAGLRGTIWMSKVWKSSQVLLPFRTILWSVGRVMLSFGVLTSKNITKTSMKVRIVLLMRFCHKRRRTFYSIRVQKASLRWVRKTSIDSPTRNWSCFRTPTFGASKNTRGRLGTHGDLESGKVRSWKSYLGLRISFRIKIAWNQTSLIFKY